MKSDDFQNQFSKAVLTAVFVGFITTIVCLGYNIFYREETGLIPSELINVSTLIFGVNLFFFISGMIYYVFRKASKRGDVLFVVVFSLLTIFLAWKAEGVNRTTDHETSLQFRGLLLGIILIAGVAVSFVVPFLFHNRKFNKSVL